MIWRRIRAVVLVWTATAAVGAAVAQEKTEHRSSLQEYVHGKPAQPTTAWTLAAGGRIYDTWWDAIDRKAPKTTNPGYPATGGRSGANTWRCVECHGWDYKGAAGVTSKTGPFAERYTGIKGIRDARNLSDEEILKKLRDKAHNYTPEMISDEELRRVAAFVRSGQHDTDRYIDRKTGKVAGDAKRGAVIFQTTCAACHGFDGRALNWGKPDDPAYVGTEASKLPWEVLHKIRNSHPGAAMINLRALPFKDAIDVLTYAQGLPTK